MGAGVRIVLVDDDVAVRDVLRVVLELDPELHVVAEAGSGPEGVAVVAKEHPDVVMLDDRMPDGNGIDSLALMRQASPASKIVLFTAFEDGVRLRAALEGGVTTLLTKQSTPNEVIDLVHRLGEHGITPASTG
jgi:DNA-binding NarL/FixJ family response regulator